MLTLHPDALPARGAPAMGSSLLPPPGQWIRGMLFPPHPKGKGAEQSNLGIEVGVGQPLL